jgi:hypothetical protein
LKVSCKRRPSASTSSISRRIAAAVSSPSSEPAEVPSEAKGCRWWSDAAAAAAAAPAPRKEEGGPLLEVVDEAYLLADDPAVADRGVAGSSEAIALALRLALLYEGRDRGSSARELLLDAFRTEPRWSKLVPFERPDMTLPVSPPRTSEDLRPVARRKRLFMAEPMEFLDWREGARETWN